MMGDAAHHFCTTEFPLIFSRAVEIKFPRRYFDLSAEIAFPASFETSYPSSQNHHGVFIAFQEMFCEEIFCEIS